MSFKKIAIIVALSFLVLSPSFNLALTGDDFLGLWRYNYYLSGREGGHWNNFSFFLTDYGPQDTFTALIHNFFGFQPIYYFIFSYLLRLFAAFSFSPLILYLTKNKNLAFLSALFFSVITTGLETTNWSFNMPSYLAIGILNFFLLTLFKQHERFTKKGLFYLGVLFVFTILAQPIRMVFLPFFAILIELYAIFRSLLEKTRKNTLYCGIRIIMYILLFSGIFIFGKLGTSFGAGETFSQRVLEGGWLKLFGNTSNALVAHLKQGDFQLLLNPFIQVGSILLPDKIFFKDLLIINRLKYSLFFLIPSFIFYVLMLWRLELLTKFNKLSLTLFIFLGAIWAVVFWDIKVIQTPYSPLMNQIFIGLIGGYSVLLLLLFFIKTFLPKKHSIYLFSALGLLVLPFLVPWIRDPTLINESTGRYLIIPAAGFVILLPLLIESFNNKVKPFLVGYLFIPLILIHIAGSVSYLTHLTQVRGFAATEKIRNAIPYAPGFGDKNTLLMFYFESDNPERLDQALMFGFPVFMGFKYNFTDIWHFGYTTDWHEVEAAYKDGSGLKRFTTPTRPVAINNIYSFKLEGDSLINTTITTRQRLLQETAVTNPAH